MTQPASTQSAPRWIKYFFIAVLLLASAQLMRDLGNINLGYININDALAPFANILGVQSNALVAKARFKDLQYDNYHRCQNKLGLSYDLRTEGTLFTTQEISNIHRNFMTQMFESGMRYVQIQVLSATENDLQNLDRLFEIAVNYSLVPIVIIGEQNNQGENPYFDSADKIIEFYNQLSNRTNTIDFIGTAAPLYLMDGRLGNPHPDDPNFGSDFVFGKMLGVAHTVANHPSIRGDRDVSMAIPPIAIFPTSNNIVPNGDVITPIKEQLNAEEFDFILMSARNNDINFGGGVSGTNPEGLTGSDRQYVFDHMRAYDYLQYGYELSGIKDIWPPKNWVSEFREEFGYPMKLIMTDFGIGQNSIPSSYGDYQNNLTSRQKLIDRLSYDYGLMADDPEIAGVIMNYSDPIFPLKFENDEYSTITLAGNNCNYDSVDYGVTYSDTSTAMVCDTDIAKSADKARSNIVCTRSENGEISCGAEIQFTVQVGLPIRHFASNNPGGTDTKPYPTWSGILASQVDSAYNTQNQFALALTSSNGGPTYPMPQLGSAINNTAELLKLRFFSPTSEWQFSSAVSPGSGLAQSRLENTASLNSDELSYAGYSQSIFGGVGNIPEERALQIGSIYIDKQLIEMSAEQREYDFRSYSKVLDESTNLCNGNISAVMVDPQDMTYGTEVKLSSESWSGTGAELCYSALTNGQVKGNTAACSVRSTLDCTCDTYQGSFAPVITTWGLQNGFCGITSSEKINRCISLNFDLLVSNTSSNVTSYSESPFYIEADFPETPKYDIPGAYDSLAAIYRTVQDTLNSRGMKLVMNGNWGWRGEVITRAYSAASDAYQISNPRTNQMLETLPAVQSGVEYTIPGLSDDKYFTQFNRYLAEGDNQQVEYQYYEILGLIDELTRIYYLIGPGNDLPTSEIITTSSNGCPVIQPSLSNQGLAELIAGVPSCDNPAVKQAISEGAQINCIAAYVPNVASSCFQADPLAVSLCEKGYGMEECVGICPVITSDTTNDTLPTGLNGKLTCPLPTNHACFQGPYGEYTHCQEGTKGLPLDLFPGFPISRTGSFDERDERVVSPESGVIVGIDRSYSYGAIITLKGLSDIVYYLYHVDYDRIHVDIGDEVTVGQHIADLWRGYGYENIHVHVRATLREQNIDPYYLFGDLLGCNAGKANPVDLPYGSSTSGITCRKCNYQEDGSCSYTLNDNGYCASSNNRGSKIGNGLVAEALVNTYGVSFGYSNLKTNVNTDTVASSDVLGAQEFSCSAAQCKNLNDKNGISYPSCTNNTYSLCQDSNSLNEYFGTGSGDTPLSCSTIRQSVESKLQSVNFLGNEIRVNQSIANVLREIEADILEPVGADPVTVVGTVYKFRSGDYTFSIGGGYEPDFTQEGNSCTVGKLAWGNTITINTTNNLYQSNSCSLDVPPEVVYAFEKNGFKWGGREATYFDPSIFSYCSNTQSGNTDKPPTSGIPNYCPVVDNSPGKLSDGEITREDVLLLCSPTVTGWSGAELTVDDVYEAFSNLTSSDFSRTPERTARIQEILNQARTQDINPAFLFGFWYTEGGFRGDGVAGKVDERYPVGYDFGCGISSACGITNRYESFPGQSVVNSAFSASLACASKTNQSCKLVCDYKLIGSTTAATIPGYGVQQPGLGGFLECYGPVIDNNPHFARNFTKLYDTFFPPGTSAGRKISSECIRDL